MSNERLRVRGVGRDAGNNKFLSVAFNREPTNDELRKLHDYMFGILNVDVWDVPQKPPTLEDALQRFKAWKFYRDNGKAVYESDELKDAMLLYDEYWRIQEVLVAIEKKMARFI